MDKLSFIVSGREVKDSVAVKMSISFIKGKNDEANTNELPIILNALKQNENVDPYANVCFTYTFPFELAGGHGFPYVFDFELENKGLLTLT